MLDTSDVYLRVFLSCTASTLTHCGEADDALHMIHTSLTSSKSVISKRTSPEATSLGSTCDRSTCNSTGPP